MKINNCLNIFVNINSGLLIEFSRLLNKPSNDIIYIYFCVRDVQSEISYTWLISISNVVNCFRCPGRELYGFPRRYYQTWPPLRARTCGLQSLRMLSFRAEVVPSHLLYATVCEYPGNVKDMRVTQICILEDRIFPWYFGHRVRITPVFLWQLL